VHACFDQLGEERCKLLTHMSADGADWIAGPAAARAPQAVLCADPFHVVSWATGALGEVRREVWRTARRAGATNTVKHRNRTSLLPRTPVETPICCSSSSPVLRAMGPTPGRSALVIEQLRDTLAHA
jgi:transposase